MDSYLEENQGGGEVLGQSSPLTGQQGAHWPRTALLLYVCRGKRGEVGLWVNYRIEKQYTIKHFFVLGVSKSNFCFHGILVYCANSQMTSKVG